MGLINRFLKLFGGNNQQPQPQQPQPKQPQQPQQQAHPQATQSEKPMNRWERERLERIESVEAKLKDWIIITIQEKEGLAFSWESGHDEGFLSFDNNDGIDEDNYNALEGYLFDLLDIPSAGEFQMN